MNKSLCCLIKRELSKCRLLLIYWIQVFLIKIHLAVVSSYVCVARIKVSVLHVGRRRTASRLSHWRNDLGFKNVMCEQVLINRPLWDISAVCKATCLSFEPLWLAPQGCYHRITLIWRSNGTKLPKSLLSCTHAYVFGSAKAEQMAGFALDIAAPLPCS